MTTEVSSIPTDIKKDILLKIGLVDGFACVFKFFSKELNFFYLKLIFFLLNYFNMLILKIIIIYYINIFLNKKYFKK